MATHSLKRGDIIRAKPGTSSAIFAEGRTGTVVELYDINRGGGGVNNLVRWEGDCILFSFYPENVERVEQ